MKLPRAGAPAASVLFIGNSFIFGTGSAVHYYRSNLVTDLNDEGIGGVPAVFKSLTEEAGLNVNVSLETSPGKGLDYHIKEKADIIGRPWDHVVMLGYSTLDQKHPGDPALLIRSSGEVANLLHQKNPNVDIRLIATWSRADQTYPKDGHWYGKPIEAMALDIRAAYDQAAAASPYIHGVIPVGESWLLAFKTGVADPNPYDGISFGQIDLWTYDHYHPSTFGYYLEALMVFGDLTGMDPRAFGNDERCAFELGFSKPQTEALQKIAFDQLSTMPAHQHLEAFTPVAAAKKSGPAR